MSSEEQSRPLAVHVIDELPPDGAERLLVDLMRRRTGQYRYAIVCLVRGGPLEEDFAALGVPIHIIGRRSKVDIRMILILARWFRQERVAVVHTHLFTADLFGRIAARLGGVRGVFSTSHNVNDWKSAGHRIVDRLLSLISSRVIGCTEEVGRVLVVRDGLSPTRVAVVENGVDLRRFDSVSPEGVRSEFDVEDDAVLMGVVGRLHPQKGHADLLQALVELRGLTDRKFRCLFVGDGELRRELENEVSQLGLRDIVRFTGLRKDVPRLLVALDLFVMPSRWEGLPMALLEAMACSKACVVTAVGGIPSVVDDGVNGLMLPPERPGDMAAAIARIISDDNLRIALGTAARESALRRYDVGRVMHAYEEMYDEALGRARVVTPAAADGVPR